MLQTYTEAQCNRLRRVGKARQSAPNVGQVSTDVRESEALDLILQGFEIFQELSSLVLDKLPSQAMIIFDPFKKVFLELGEIRRCTEGEFQGELLGLFTEMVYVERQFIDEHVRAFVVGNER